MKMKIPEKDYSVDEFLEYLREHFDDLFDENERKNWLKIYCILVSDIPWQTTLFKTNEVTQLGEIFKIAPEPESSNDTEEPYYAVEYCQGLLLLFTTAKKADYRNSMENRLKKSIGAMPMWIKSDFFRRFWKETTEQNNGSFVYNFTSKRRLLDDTPCRIRPNYERRFNYTGEDATQTMQEIEEMYGVIPTSVYIQVNETLRVHLTNEGLFSAQEPSSIALALFFNYLDKIKDPILKMRRVSKSLKFDIAASESKIKSASVDVGVIRLQTREIDADTTEKLTKELKDYSFIDKNVEVGSLSFTATVIDENKGSVFDISASESKILIVPKYRWTFESLLGFYRSITESIDEQAELSVIDEE